MERKKKLMRKYKCKYDIEFQDIKEILDFMDDHYADKTAFIYKSKDRKSQTEISFPLSMAARAPIFFTKCLQHEQS